MPRTISSLAGISALTIGLLATPASAQTQTQAIGPVIDIMGQWSGTLGTQEEQPLRGDPGVEVGEFVGMPINDAARAHGNTWQPTWGSLPEWQNRPHPITYSMRAPAVNIRITADVDPVYQNITAYHIDNLFGRADRIIYMDGRPRPSKYAEHKYQGFSLGTWENGVLKVVTTHIKYAFIHRNGLPTSPYAVVTEYFIPHGTEWISHVYMIDDPIYLTEPLVRTTTLKRAPLQGVGRSLPYEVVEELATLKRGEVPAYPFGTVRTDYADMHGIPLEAAQGGAFTALPEYSKRVQELMKQQPAKKPATPPATTSSAQR